VCTNGHDDGREACAPARARGRQPAGPRGRPKRSLRADKGCPRSRFSARLTGGALHRSLGGMRDPPGRIRAAPAKEHWTRFEVGTGRRREGGRA